MSSVSVKGPYPSIGKEIGHSIRGPTTRHYASGKPDDETIEANCKGFDYRNHQFIVYVTMHDIEHDDNISLKLGGTHMGTGWFDQGVSFEAGRCCLGKEEEHPSTQACVLKGPSVGSLLDKKVGVCATYYADENFCELFTDIGDGKGWVKQMEAKDIGGFNPEADEFEAQLRIDGFSKGSVPTIHNAVVQPIAPRGSSAPTPTPSPSPAPSPSPSPTPSPSSGIKFEAVATGKRGRRWRCTSGGKSWFAGPDYKFQGKLVREVYPYDALDTKPAGVVKEGGWGANDDAKTWKIVNMRDRPELFKVVDSAGINVATDFKTQLDAQKYIDYFKYVAGSTAPPESPGPAPSPSPSPSPAPQPQAGILWTSKGKFDNGKAIVLKEKEFAYGDTLQAKNHQIEIDGKGTMTLRGMNPDDPGGNRVYIKVNNYNVECECDAILDPASSDVNIKLRSNHHFFEGCGFGGYGIGFEFADKATRLKMEPVHGIYSDRMAEVDCPVLEYNKKVGLKAKVYDTANGDVINEAWVKEGGINSDKEWKLYTKWTHKNGEYAEGTQPLDADDKAQFAEQLADNGPGNFKEGDEDKLGKPFKDIGHTIWIRSNATEDNTSIKSTQISNVTVREI